MGLRWLDDCDPVLQHNNINCVPLFQGRVANYIVRSFVLPCSANTRRGTYIFHNPHQKKTSYKIWRVTQINTDSSVLTQKTWQTQDVYPRMISCWASVVNSGSTSNQHRANALCVREMISKGFNNQPFCIKFTLRQKDFDGKVIITSLSLLSWYKSADRPWGESPDPRLGYTILPNPVRQSDH